jgi:hypothetical protein
MANGYRAVPIQNFGGLDLRSDQIDDAAGVRAINIRDIELEAPGIIKQRAGTTKIYSHSSAVTYDGAATYQTMTAGLDPQIVTLDTATGRVYAHGAVSGTAVANNLPGGATGGGLGRLLSSVMIGTPTTTNIMYLGVKGATLLLKYNGATFSNVTGIGPFEHMAVQYPDNRLVGAWTPTSTWPARISFSNPNNPEVFGATDYVDLLPGDGERIVGMCNWRNYVFVFKQSAWFRFYGNSTDPTGGSIFNYDTYRHGLLSPYIEGMSVCTAGREGVYFLARDGVYITDGGPPRKISSQLDPLFTGGERPGYWTGPAQIHTAGLLAQDLKYIDGRLYLTVMQTSSTSSAGHVFVYLPQQNVWTYWSLMNGRGTRITGLTGVSLTTGRETPYFVSQTNPSSLSTVRSIISYLDPTTILDQDHDISVGLTGTYRTEFMDLGDSESVKTVREFLLEGTGGNGPITLNTYVDSLAGTLSSAWGNITPLPIGGTWPNYRIGEARLREAARGRNISLEVQGTGGMAVHRVTLHLRDQRPAGVKQT